MIIKFFSALPWLFLLCLYYTMLIMSIGASNDDRKTYIVYMGDLPGAHLSAQSLHTSMLESVLGSKASSSILHSYTRSFNGFVVKLTNDEMLRVAAMKGVVSVFPNRKMHLHTTRSWDFMGFPEQVERTTIESDVIVGVIDTGIWPESDSFNDTGFGPPPTKWKGICQNSTNFSCNNKIIGARYFPNEGIVGPEEFISPRDAQGHGTHTASIAAGGLVTKASLFGLAQGTARGAVPSARIAVYKVCWSGDACDDAGILAAFDHAIADGVDIISISIGRAEPLQYFEDPIAIGSFHAMRNGILTSASAGNYGPDFATLSNYSPWQLVVAASTIDRVFFPTLKLGNGETYVSQVFSVNTFDMGNTSFPMIYGGDAPNVYGGFNGSVSRLCIENSLSRRPVKGKILLCDMLTDAEPAWLAGAAGVVVQSFFNDTDAFPLPGMVLSVDDYDGVYNYMIATRHPSATIMKSNEENDTSAPYVSPFSSRGPIPWSSYVLKPDIAAPGFEILAAWSLAATVSGVKGDNRRVPYNIISGTSMSCPHASGVAAYIKSFHPSWSPAAIKSAIMTTAFPMNATTSPEVEFAYGAGHINPMKAVNPGLVYDAGEVDYINYLCGQGYDNYYLRNVSGDDSTCNEATNTNAWDLNLPSFSLPTKLPNPYVNQNFSRTVTNVGSPTSVYRATIYGSDTLQIEVQPQVLSFTSIGQALTFVVTVSGTLGQNILSASMVWDDGVNQVRSPIVVYLVP